MLRPELRRIESNDAPVAEWRSWQPPDPANTVAWLTLTIGPAGEPGADLFQVAVATPRGLAAHKASGGRVGRGFIVERYDADAIEAILRSFVESIADMDWTGCTDQLQEKLYWEYGNDSGEWG